MNCISEQDLDEMNIEIIRNTLYKVTGLSAHFVMEICILFHFTSKVITIYFFRYNRIRHEFAKNLQPIIYIIKN